MTHRPLDLATLPPEIFSPASYAEKPKAFRPFSDAILQSSGVVVVSPEYNGGIPGVLKYFIDMLKFPESFTDRPVCFVGLAAGMWGALRPIEGPGRLMTGRLTADQRRPPFFNSILEVDSRGRLRESDGVSMNEGDEAGTNWRASVDPASVFALAGATCTRRVRRLPRSRSRGASARPARAASVADSSRRAPRADYRAHRKASRRWIRRAPALHPR